MWSLVMGNTESSASDEDEEKTKPEEVIKVFQPSKLREELENVAKHRIPSPTREAGDGMEAAKSSPTGSSPSVSESSAKLIKLPQTNISLKKLPPITDDNVRLPATEPTSPLVPIATSQPAYRPAKPFQGTKKSKEPRFVPYEPYKAAITPLISVAKKKHSKESRGSAVTNETPVGDQLDGPSTIQGLAKEEREQYEREINELKAKLEDSEKQLRIQHQVNCEVKKLLVASVGEDIEAQVDFLTQDKARLAADIRQYSSKMSRDFEEKEKLSVESDLWKSKFLASSVIVDELARWKGILMQRSDDCDHYIRLMLHERNVLWSTMSQTLDVVHRLKSAFDPLKSMENTVSKEIEAASILGMTDLTYSTVQDLKNRLLGATQLKHTEAKEAMVIKQLDTPAEEGLRHIIASPASNITSSELSDRASLALTGAARPHLAKLGDQVAGARQDFKCCTHCQGVVHVV